MNKITGKNKYWDINDLLATNEKVNCLAERDLANVAELDKSSAQMNSLGLIKEGTKFELPLWIAIPFHLYENTITMNAPKYFNKKMNNNMQADPTIINLKQKTNYFYDICMKLLPFLDEDKIWSRCLITSFAKRYFKLVMNSSNIQNEDINIQKNLCLREMIFYEKMLSLNKELKHFIQNYRTNNKVIPEGSMGNAKRKKFK